MALHALTGVYVMSLSPEPQHSLISKKPVSFDQLLLLGKPTLSHETNIDIINAVHKFIKETKRSPVTCLVHKYTIC